MVVILNTIVNRLPLSLFEGGVVSLAFTLIGIRFNRDNILKKDVISTQAEINLTKLLFATGNMVSGKGNDSLNSTA